MKKIVLFTISVIMSISLFGAKYDHLYIEGDELVITHREKASDYQVYNTVGQLVHSGTLTDGVARVALAGHGIYVVRADEASRMVIK